MKSYASKDAYFSIKEVDVGLAAGFELFLFFSFVFVFDFWQFDEKKKDVGTLQRMPRIMGNEGLVRELAFTARKMFAQEAYEHGFVTRVFESKEILLGFFFLEFLFFFFLKLIFFFFLNQRGSI